MTVNSTEARHLAVAGFFVSDINLLLQMQIFCMMQKICIRSFQ